MSKVLLIRYLLFLLAANFLHIYSTQAQTIRGIDVSHDQGRIDWPTVQKYDNVTFAWAKATEGVSGVGSGDPTFSINMRGGTNAKIVMGAYHVGRPDNNNSPVTEANHFLDSARAYIGIGYLPPALDIEEQVAEKVNNTSSLATWIQQWMETIKNATGIVPILYVGGNYARMSGFSSLTGYKLWIADPNFNPTAQPTTGVWNSWAFNQYAGGEYNTLMISGIKYIVDLDVFNGDITAFNSLIGLSSSTALPDVSITAGTQSVTPSTVTAGSNVTVSCSEDNSGDGNASANNVTVWLSKDGILTGADTELGTIAFPSVAANSNTLINSTTVQIPPGTPAGTYYLFFWADGNQTVPESDERNNFASQIITVTNSQQASLTLTLVPQCNGILSGLTLSWNVVAGATSYDIYRGGSLYTSISGTRFDNTNVTAGQSYSYYIVAQVPSGSVTSNTANSTAPNCTTNLPGAFALTVTSACTGSSSQVTLNWTASNNANSYDVYRNNGLYNSGLSGVQFIDNSVSAGQNYSYYIVAKNSSGTATSNTQSVNAQNCSVLPGIPSVAATSVCNSTSSQIKLDWTATANTTSYQIYKNNSYYTTVTSNAEYVDDLVTPGLVYSYYIIAKNSSGGTKSAYASATASNCTTLPLPGKPALVVRANCTGGTTKIALTWGADNNTNSYDIYRNYSYYATVGNATQYVDYAVIPDSAYLYYVEAKNSTGSTDSDLGYGVGLDCTPNFPSAPVLSAIPLCNGNSGQVTLNWTTSNNAVGYDVYRDNTLLYTAFGDLRQYVDQTASSGNHSYYIAASNGSGLTNSNNISIAVPNCAPTPSITSITPLIAESGTVVTINGANFDNTTTATFGGVPAQSVTVVSPTKIQAVVGIGASGNIVVTNQGGATTASGFNFVFSLPPDNFSISGISATCKGTSDGAISINANQVLNYWVKITGNNHNDSTSFTIADTIKNLSAGVYHICLTVNGQQGYQQCYDVTITEPKDLSVYSTVNEDHNTLSLLLKNGETYFIQLNGITYTTSNNSITLPLRDGSNELSVTTDKLCQGTYKTVIDLLKKIIPFPDPFDNTLSINLGNGPITSALFEVHNTANGKILYSKRLANQSGVVQLELGGLTEGVYALYIKLDNIQRIYKIIKK
ncbi:MAG: hypothetical protein JST19_02310 [Bacteroidetes bacterium]|nr:hypothetical protein [Bacteroidota bacterium]